MPRFGEVLGDVLSEKKLSQREFARHIGYDDSVVSRLINGSKLPLNIRELKRMIDAIHCNDTQVGQLIVAFVCEILRGKGLGDE